MTPDSAHPESPGGVIWRASTRLVARDDTQRDGRFFASGRDKKDPILTAIAGSGKNISKETVSGPIRDAGLIATAQKIEHYEIASYGSARDWATQLGLADPASVLQTTLDEEACGSASLTAAATRQ